MRVFITLFSFLFVTFNTTFAQEKGIRFVDNNLKNALKQAKQENKFVFVDFMATWCGPCKRMMAETFSAPVVSEYFNKKFVNIQIDVDKEKVWQKSIK